MSAQQPSEEPTSAPPPVKTNREWLDEILRQVEKDRELLKRLVEDPRATLESLGFDHPTSLDALAGEWGIGPVGDCGHDTCRLTDPCGWTVCGKTTNSCADFEDELRIRMDQVLDQVRSDPGFRQKLVTDPIETLGSLDFEPATARYVADHWGIGPVGDCGHDTCRLTDPCGWTVCGKTTNSCAEFEDELRIRMDQVLDQVRSDPGFRQKLVTDPIETLGSLDFEPATARYVADHWGIGPVGDCGHDTCRLTDPCGWTVCGKTTNSCADFEVDLRDRMDMVLDQVKGDDGLRTRLLEDPQGTLDKIGFDPDVTRYVADHWGIGPVGDCGHDTCRLTDPCGWTVCGKTTNSCAQGSAAS